MGIRGVWSLENVELKKPVDDWVEIPNVFLTQDDIAHSRPYPTPNLQRWNLGTSTMTNTSLSCSRYWGQASGNTTFSYFAGGGISPGIIGQTSTDKLSYSPYTFAATPTANTTFPIRSGGALSSNLAAYITAAYNSTGSPSYNGSWVDKILFATDTKSTLSDKFGENGNSWASLSDGKGGGYNFNGDVPSPARAKLYKITYSTDGMAYVPASNTLTARRESSAEMMNPSAGYNTGGDLSGPISSTEKLSWSTGTWTAVPGGKLVRVTKRMASGSGRSHGFAGGGDGNVAPVYTDFYKLDFSTETFGRDPALNFLGSNHGYYPQKSTTTPLDGLYGADKAFDRNSFWSGDNGKRWFDSALGGSYGVGFDGSGDYLQMASSSDLTFGTGDFTIEFYVNATNFTNRGTFYDSRPSSGNTGITIGHEASSGEIRVYMNAGHGGDIVVQSTDFTTGVWYHIAVTRSSGTVRLFINGTEKDSETRTSDMNNTNVVNIGYKSYSSSGYNYLNGTISSFRVLKGTALYTSNFDRPIIALTNISDTKLLCCQSSSSTTTKEVGPTITANGDPTVILSQTLPTGPPAPTPTATSGPWQYQLNPGVPNHGYYLGGSGSDDTGSTNSMKFSFATDTFDNSVRLTNQFTTSAGGKMASSPSHAYCVYGQGNPAPGGDTGVSWCRKIQYSNDTGSNAPNAVDQPSHKAAVAGSITNMYVAGGQDSHGVPLATRTNIRKLTYSNDTWSTISQSNANYSNPSGWPRANFASGGTQTYALWGWGSPNNYRTSISKYTYASDTGVFAIPGVTADYSQGSGQVGNSNSTHWWLARGNTSNGGPFQSKISRWTFATDTPQFPTTLTDEWYDYSDANGTGAINDGMTAGYWCGGHQDQSNSTSTLKISYATETASRGTDIPAGRTPGANGAFNGYAGTSVREFGAETTITPNLI